MRQTKAIRAISITAILSTLWVCETISHAALLKGKSASQQALAVANPGELMFAPYLQLGHSGLENQAVVQWATPGAADADWALEYEREDGWSASPAQAKTIDILGMQPFSLLSANIPLQTSARSRYRVKHGENVLFQADAPAYKNSDLSFAVLGDSGSGSNGEKDIALQMYKLSPDLLLHAGDIVYQNGTVSEYLVNFFPYYAAKQPSKDGVPLLSKVLSVACAGNHDVEIGDKIDSRDLNRFPDGLAYFLFWNQPLNGLTQAKNIPVPIASPEQMKQFMERSKSSYPRMTNFHFKMGTAFFLVLDANPYVNTSDPQLQKWVRQMLHQAQDSKWKIVIFHQPPFTSDFHHFEEQRMRLLAPIFQEEGVDLVFNGHSHSYQRSKPLRFTPKTTNAVSKKGFVYGTFQLDRTFDGTNDTTPEGVIYVISGGGGAPLTSKSFQEKLDHWQPFTAKFFSDRFSFTSCEIRGNRFTLKQVDDRGKVFDQIAITK